MTIDILEVVAKKRLRQYNEKFGHAPNAWLVSSDVIDLIVQSGRAVETYQHLRLIEIGTLPDNTILATHVAYD